MSKYDELVQEEDKLKNKLEKTSILQQMKCILAPKIEYKMVRTLFMEGIKARTKLLNKKV